MRRSGRGDERQDDSVPPVADRATVPTAERELALVGRGLRHVAGLDEVGRGCIAGPVVACAIVLHPVALKREGRLSEVRDSKQLSAETREDILDAIAVNALSIGLGVISACTIDRIGIVPATRLAMQEALKALRVAPEFLLLDYLTLPAVALPQEGIVHGDALCFSIAAASIVAKVARDRLMAELDAVYPGYGFAQHKGYYTPQHIAALDSLGPCLLHRHSFAPIAQQSFWRAAR